MLNTLKQILPLKKPKNYKDLAATFTGDMDESQTWDFINNLVTSYCIENGFNLEHRPITARKDLSTKENILGEKESKPTRTVANYQPNCNILSFDENKFRELVKNKGFIEIFAVIFHELTHFKQKMNGQENKEILDHDFGGLRIFEGIPEILAQKHETNAQAQMLYLIWQYCSTYHENRLFYLQYPHELDAREQAIHDTKAFIDLIAGKLQPEKHKRFLISTEKKEKELIKQKVFRTNQYLTGNRHVNELKTTETEVQEYLKTHKFVYMRETIADTLKGGLPNLGYFCGTDTKENRDLYAQIDDSLLMVLKVAEPLLTNEQKSEIANAVMQKNNAYALVEVGKYSQILDEKTAIAKLAEINSVNGLRKFSENIKSENDLFYLNTLASAVPDAANLAELMAHFMTVFRLKTDGKSLPENMRFALKALSGNGEAKQIFLKECISKSIDVSAQYEELDHNLGRKSIDKEMADFLTTERSLAPDEIKRIAKQVEREIERKAKKKVDEYQSLMYEYQDQSPTSSLAKMKMQIKKEATSKVMKIIKFYGREKDELAFPVGRAISYEMK